MRGAPSHPPHAHTAAYAELQRLLERLSRRIGAPQIFADFVELSSIALSIAVDRTQFASREARYQQIRKDYPANESEQVSTMLGLLTVAMEAAGFEDLLGGLYMGLGLGDRRHGQFFTPYSISQLMAAMVVEPARDRCRRVAS
ncbi:hypothetical protein [Stenotrophomonas geniculata]|uniref:hypothetical protein n=1 Tax=Stenotrophomonas geniculata TaxID=86188 RepID=UPI00234FA23F|nr:hypothetical protein [Stenotrophomonas geniculata]MDC7801495.1 hypothetical protein [Stenotrophomonas geniculata]